MADTKSKTNYAAGDVVRSCEKLEAGLRFGQEGVSACALGPFQSPIYWSADEAAKIEISKEMLIDKRKKIFDMLNDDYSETPCKGCQMVTTKKYEDVEFSRLGHIDFSETSLCNIRCDYCCYTKHDSFKKSKFDSLNILQKFSADDVEWNSAVDFGGGEPTVLPNFTECIDYFKSRGIRVFLYTNAVKFSQAAYDGLVKGNISWLCVSLDCGTSSTYNKTKQRDYFPRVMENLFKYVEASKKGHGNVSVKYIFTENNCGEDDLYGFTFAMLALQADKIWLTFDFEPTKGLDAGADEFGLFDYTNLIEAYVKLYLLMKQYGLEPGHFEENHLSQVSRQGQILLERVKDGIAKEEGKTEKNTENLLVSLGSEIVYFHLNPLQIHHPGKKIEDWSLQGKRVLLAPVSDLSVSLMADVGVSAGNVVGFVDRDPTLQNKVIHGGRVHGYDEIEGLKVDIVLLAVHQQYRKDIIKTLQSKIDKSVIIAVMA